jgi:ribose transport system permease protein
MAHVTTIPTPPLRRGGSGWIGRNSWVLALGAALLLWLLAGAVSGHLSLRLLLVNATLATFLALAGVAQMVVIASGDGSFDLSLPYVITMSALLSAGAVSNAHTSSVWNILIALAAGLVVGLLNGVLTAGLSMPAMVASLSSGYIVYTVILLLEARGHFGVSVRLGDVIRAQADGAAVILIVTVVIGAILAYLLTRTIYGRHLHAMGQSRAAARLSGVRLARMIVANFALSGFMGAGVGVLLAAYNRGAFQNIGDVYLLGSVAAVVVGGVPVSGGRSSVPATMLGALVMTLIITVLQVTGLGAGVQDVLEGLTVILIVVAAQIARGRRRG